MNKRHYEHTLPNIRGSLSNTYISFSFNSLKIRFSYFPVLVLQGRIHYFLRHERTKQAA